MGQLTKSLKEEADAARKAEAEAAAQARSAVDKEEEMLRKHQNKSVWNKIVDGTVQMFTGVRPYQPTPGCCGSKEMMEKEQRAEEERKKIQDSLREQNKVLADNVAALRGFSCDANGLEETIKCLKTVVSILCKVVTTFKNVRLFWECMVGHCQVLANMNKDFIEDVVKFEEENAALEAPVKADFAELELTSKVKLSAVNWAALGKINMLAFRAMEETNKITDKGFNELGDTNMEALAGKIEAILADMAKDDAELQKLDVAEPDAANKRQKIGER